MIEDDKANIEGGGYRSFRFRRSVQRRFLTCLRLVALLATVGQKYQRRGYWSNSTRNFAFCLSILVHTAMTEYT